MSYDPLAPLPAHAVGVVGAGHSGMSNSDRDQRNGESS